jgi:hypothetical protein
MRVWNDKQFTIYPFQAGIPFYFVKEEKIWNSIADIVLTL